MEATPIAEPNQPRSAPRARLASLDALRGFDMFWIIGGGAVFKGLAKALDTPALNSLVPQLEHVRWEGLHLWDLIWPLFMFIVGVAIPLSVAGRRDAGASDRSILLHGLRRALILFVLGMAAQGHLLAWDLSKLRPCYSVLHGIAAGYLIALAVAMRFRPKIQAAITAGFLLLYWALMTLVPVPGVGAGVLTPDGNFATWVDRVVLGRFHFGENTWFVSYLGFASSVLLGVLAGHLLTSARESRAKVLALLGAGVACLGMGLLWSPAFPIIKLIWSSSFVLVGGGLSMLALAAFYWIIDVLGYRRWAFFFSVIGMNSIAVYMATMLFDFRTISSVFVGSLLPRLGAWDDLMGNGAALAVVWLALYWMYRTKTFVRI